ncbi:MAG: hypothetical protein HQM10_18560 [Candidatus Riflebacteria bacterium]|nr:hypothetical protein [Candidatus Riflebacteria bacterium]
MKKNHPLAKKTVNISQYLIIAAVIAVMFLISISWSGKKESQTSSGTGISSVAPSAPAPAPVPVPRINLPHSQPQIQQTQKIELPSEQRTGNTLSYLKYSAITPPVNSILADTSGILWIAHEKGISKLKEGVLTSVKFSAPNATSLVHDGTKLWVGSFFGLFSTSDGKTFTSYRKSDGLLSEMIYSLLYDGKILWAGTQAGVAFQGTDGKFYGIDKKISNGGLADIWIGSLSRIDSFIACGNDDGLSIWDLTKPGADPNSWITLDMFSSSLPHNWILSQCVFQKKIFLGTPHGLASLEKSPAEIFQGSPIIWKTFKTANGLPGDRVNALAATDDSLWIGTSNGLAVYKNGKFKKFGKPEGLESTNIRCLFAGSDSTLWIGTDKGIQTFDLTAIPM